MEYFKNILRRAYNYDEALRRQNIDQSDVTKLRERIKDSKFIPKFMTDKQVLLFLNAANSNVEKAAAKLEVYYELKKTAPEFFKNRDVHSDAIQSSLDHQNFIDLPISPDNCILFFHDLSSPEAKHYVFDEAVKTFAISIEASLYNKGPRSGTILIFDLKKMSFWHIFQPGVNSMRKGMRFLQEGSPVDIKAIHVLNSVPFSDVIVGILKPFTRNSLLNKIHFHSPNMDYEKFFDEFVPKSHMPSDYGGDLESVEVLHAKHREGLMKVRDYFLVEEHQVNGDFDEYAEYSGIEKDCMEIDIDTKF